MYGIPGYDGREVKRSGTGMSAKDWAICIGASALMIMVVIAVLMGVQAVFVDTMRQAFPR